jgi:DNA-binding transcriptional LysR family regulator
MTNDELPRIDLRLLRQFVGVAEELHFTRAAKRLGMSQPPLTAAVRRLEQEVGAVLIERGRKTVRLTPAGAVLLVEARRLLGAAGDALAATRLSVSAGGCVSVMSVARCTDGFRTCCEHSGGRIPRSGSICMR